MSLSTPKQSKKADVPAKTPGWGAALFGLFSTQKEPRPVDSGTKATARPRTHHHEIHLPTTGSSSFSPQRTAPLPNGSTTIDLLDTVEASHFDPAKSQSPTSSAQAPAKSPWKSPPPSLNGGASTSAMATTAASSIYFSHGNLKPPPMSKGRVSHGQTGMSIGRTRQRRLRARLNSRLLTGTAKRRATSSVNAANAERVLQQSHSLFPLSGRQLETHDKYAGFKAARGKRLLGSSQVGGSRLAPAAPERPASPREEPATKRRKQVMFGAAIDSTPVETELMTPVRHSVTEGGKRKATPFRAAQVDTTVDIDVTPPRKKASSIDPAPAPGPTLAHFSSTTFSRSPKEFDIPPATQARPTIQPVTDTETFSFESSHPIGAPVRGSVSRFVGCETFKMPSYSGLDFPRRERSTFNTVSVRGTSSPEKEEPAQASGSNVASNDVSTGVATKSLGWGGMFDDQKNKWKCSACLAQWEQHETKCGSCEAPRPGYEDKHATKKPSSVSKPAFASTGAGAFSLSTSASSSATNAGAIGSGGFSFGAAPVAAPTASSSSSTMTKNDSSGGFKFGGPVSTSPPKQGGFTFSADSAKEEKKELSNTSQSFQFGDSSRSTSTTKQSAPAFKFGSTQSKDSNEPKEDKPSGFSFASTSAPATSDKVEKKPFKFSVEEKKSDDDIPKISFGSASSSKAERSEALTESSTKRTRAMNDQKEKENSSNVTDKTASTTTSKRPQFNFGGSTSTSTGFQFGGSTAAPLSTAATSAPTSAPAFSFGAPAASSSKSNDKLPAFGCIPSKDTSDEDHSKRRRDGKEEGTSSIVQFGSSAPETSKPVGGFSFGSTSAPAPPASTAMSTGNAGSLPGGNSSLPVVSSNSSLTFGGGPSSSISAPATTAASASTPAPFSFGSSESKAPESNVSKAPGSSGGFSFGNGPSSGAAPVPAPAPSTGFSFGSAPAPLPTPTVASTNSNTFGSAPTIPSNGGASSAAAPSSSGFSFGSTPAPPAAPTTNTPAFGSASTAPPSGGLSFGSTPAAQSAPTFGSAPTPAPAPGGFSFGSAPSAQTPAPAGGFGSTQTPATSGFGSAPGNGAAPTAPFGSTPAPAPMTFGSAPTPAAPATFGAPAPASFGAPASGGFGGGFGGGAPAVPAQPTSFGAPSGFGAPPAPAAPGGFGGGFGAPPAAAPAAPAGFGGGAPQFNLGTGGGGSSRGGARGPGGRRIVRARRPR